MENSNDADKLLKSSQSANLLVQDLRENDQKFFSILKKTQLIIPIISLIGVVLGLFIGFATAVRWSIVVTGTTDQTGYLFGRLAVPIGIIIIALLIIYSVLPFLSGSLATIMASSESLERISLKQHLSISIFVALLYLTFYFVLFNSEWLILAIGIVFLIWRCLYFVVDMGGEDGKKTSFWKKIFLMFSFAFFALASVIVGLLILLNYTRAASIGNSKTDHNTLYFLLFLLSYVFTSSGVIYAAIGKKINISIITFVVFIIGFSMLLLNIPQNILISLNHGILPTPKTLQSAIKLATESKNANCTAMHIITHKNYRLFSCGTQKNSWKGKIFYEKMPYTFFNKVTNKNEIISKYYCFTTGENGMYLHCISRDSLVPR